MLYRILSNKWMYHRTQEDIMRYERQLKFYLKIHSKIAADIDDKWKSTVNIKSSSVTSNGQIILSSFENRAMQRNLPILCNTYAK